MMKQAIRHFWIITGTISLIAGIIGLFLPVIPTTPFILLSAFCYARGSKRLHNWLLNNKLFGIYIENYEKGKGIPIKIKVYWIIILWLSISITTTIIVKNSYIKLTLIIIAILATLYIISIKPKSKC